MTYNNGLQEIYTYNKANLVTQVLNKKDSTVLSQYDYAYDLSGRQASKTDHTGKVTTYTYDGLGQLIQEAETKDGVQVHQYSYQYDPAYNRVAATLDGKAITYTTDADNRLLSTTDEAGTTAYTYDANGNTKSVSPAGLDNTVHYVYDGLDRQTSVGPENGATTYTYYPNGLRSGKTAAGVSTVYVWDGDQLVLEQVGDTVRKYIRGLNLVAQLDGTTLSYYLYNAHGDVVQLCNADGTISQSYDYDAFGVEKESSANTNPFKYCGEYYDGETDTYYLRARNYDPALGRFTQRDTHWNAGNMIYGDEPQKMNEGQELLNLTEYTTVPQITAIRQSGNLYGYCANSPILYVDKDGNSLIATLAIGGAIGAIVSGGMQIFRNITNGKKWTTNLGRALLSGAVSGSISAISIPGISQWVSVTVTGAAGNVAGSLIAGKIESVADIYSAIAAGAVCGVIGLGASKILNYGLQKYFAGLTKAEQKEILSHIGNITNRQLQAIRQQLKNSPTNETVQQLIDKYGVSVVVSAFVSSTAAEAVS